MLNTATPATLLTALVLVCACSTAVEAKSFRNVFTDEDRFMLVPVHNEDTLTSWVRTCRMQKKLNIMNIGFLSIVANTKIRNTSLRRICSPAWAAVAVGCWGCPGWARDSCLAGTARPGPFQ